MPINLTVPQVLSNGTRLTVTQVRYFEDEVSLEYTVTLRTAGAGTPPDAEISAVRAGIRVGSSDVVSRATLIAGGNVARLLSVASSAVATDAAAFAAAVAAFKTSKAAFEAWLLSSGCIHTSLAGT